MSKEKQNEPNNPDLPNGFNTKEALAIYTGKKVKIYSPKELSDELTHNKINRKVEKLMGKSIGPIDLLAITDRKERIYLIKFDYFRPNETKEGAILSYEHLAQICKYIYKKLQDPKKKRELLIKTLD